MHEGHDKSSRRLYAGTAHAGDGGEEVVQMHNNRRQVAIEYRFLATFPADCRLARFSSRRGLSVRRIRAHKAARPAVYPVERLLLSHV